MHKAKTNLSEIVKNVSEKNEEIIIARAGVPVAIISSFKKIKRAGGQLKNKITIQDDFDILPGDFREFFSS